MKSLLSKIILKFLSAFLTLFLAGAFLGNLILIYVSLIPLLTIIFTLTFDQPRNIKIRRNENEITSYVDDSVSISVSINMQDGIGLVTLADILPEYFELVGENNFRVFWKGLGEKAETLSYKVRCTKRGIYWLNALKWESRHPFMLKQTIVGAYDDALKLIVKHKPLSIKRVRGSKIISRIPLPLGSSAKLGIATTDFREIRDYCPGDPYRSINWKATARHMITYRNQLPKVNEFEREGKKVVWIFLDKSSNMAFGSIIRNSFEYAVRAATALIRFYLERDCKVGLCIYNHSGAEKIILPDIGRRQYHNIVRELVGVEVESPSSFLGEMNVQSLRNAVRECHGYLIGSNPLFIIITTITPKNLKQILEGVREIRKYTWTMGIIRSKLQQIMIINVIGYEVATRDEIEEIAANLLELKNQYLIKEVKRLGALVTSWNPIRQSLTKLILAGLSSH